MGKLSYLPVDSDESTIQSTNTSIPGPKDDHTRSSNQQLLKSIDSSKANDEERNAIVDTTEYTTTLVSSTTKSASNPTTLETLSDPAAELTPPSVPREVVTTKCLYGPETNLLSPLSNPVPLNWKTIEQSFFTVTAQSAPQISSDMMFGDGNSLLGAHKFSIVYINTSVSRVNLGILFQKAVDGNHLDIDGCNLVYAKAYRLEPETPGGLLTVDGEIVHYGPIQAQLHPGLGRIIAMSKKKRQ